MPTALFPHAVHRSWVRDVMYQDAVMKVNTPCVPPQPPPPLGSDVYGEYLNSFVDTLSCVCWGRREVIEGGGIDSHLRSTLQLLPFAARGAPTAITPAGNCGSTIARPQSHLELLTPIPLSNEQQVCKPYYFGAHFT